ncbi:CutA1 divalent ion tolerance protein [[Leptolyngbya] sp. PCC 7376]|uniref:divalent-cation tolerance protein CutA n=1 Tax=[Leptolyngbya] sp. PCC 7376 TaxID=111781 RepID=UPI00029F0219|nr:divalent-cation tolerance protein CutA [[Leptolyngbya] sp. PCC 7376]AFY38470.1 CutA1 divalent ion tolerance protein [[Leptolyngbya] sp. PCC 7376]
MKDKEAIAVVTTTGNLEEAQRIAREIVDEKLAACAQITPIESIYRWQGDVHHSPEFKVVFKTVSVNYEAIEKVILARHSYELPEIYAIALAQSYAPYAEWISANTETLA